MISSDEKRPIVRVILVAFLPSLLTLIMLKSHVRDDARHHRAPSWQPSNTRCQARASLASLRAPLGVSQRTRHYLASRLNSSRNNLSGLLRRRRGTDYRPDCETNCNSETPSQRQTLDHL